MAEKPKEKVKLLWASSTVWTCTCCKCWVDREPDFMGEPFDKGYACEKCGCTSVHARKGRPFGPKHSGWDNILWNWNEYYDYILEMMEAFDTWDIVKTDPPLERPAPDEHTEGE